MMARMNERRIVIDLLEAVHLAKLMSSMGAGSSSKSKSVDVSDELSGCPMVLIDAHESSSTMTKAQSNSQQDIFTSDKVPMKHPMLNITDNTNDVVRSPTVDTAADGDVAVGRKGEELGVKEATTPTSTPPSSCAIDIHGMKTSQSSEVESNSSNKEEDRDDIQPQPSDSPKKGVSIQPSVPTAASRPSQLSPRKAKAIAKSQGFSNVIPLPTH